MDQFNERLARLAELTPEELDALEAEMVQAFDAADAAGDLPTMQQIADALDQVRAAKAGGDTSGNAAAPAAPVPDATMPQAAAAVTADGGDGDGDAEVTEPEEPAADDEPAADPEPEAAEPEAEAPAEPVAEDPEPEPEAEPASEPAAETVESDAAVSDAVPADGVTPSDSDAPADAPAAEVEAPAESNNESEEPVDMTADEVPEDLQPVEAAGPTYTIRAGGGIPGVTSGDELPDLDAVADAMAKKLDTIRAGVAERLVVASIRTEVDVPEGRVLRPGDAFGNAKKIRELISDKDALRPEALIAGGWCAPRAPIYDVPTLGTTRRPVKDSLPSFNADRGGIVWMQPPTLPDNSDAVSLWRFDEEDGWGSFTNPTGSGVAGDEKPCFTVPCGTEQNIDVDAIPVCLCFDNLTARAFPEWVRANTDLTMVYQARFAEQKTLAQMFGVAATGACGTPVTQLGAARDFLFTVRTAAASLRWKLRIDADSPLQLLAPQWVREAMAIDLGLQAPGDSTYGTSASDIEGYFSEAHIQPVWYIDDVPGTAVFNTCAFPNQAHWMLYPTGSFLMLDNGELNLGVVRTKEDVQANRYCEFVETFETVAHIGPDVNASGGWLIRGLTAIDLIGGTSAPQDLS